MEFGLGNGISCVLESGELIQSDRVVGHITLQEARVLSALARTPNRAVHLDSIYAALYAHRSGERCCESMGRVYIYNLRRVFKKFAIPAEIRTVRAFGYALDLLPASDISA